MDIHNLLKDFQIPKEVRPVINNLVEDSCLLLCRRPPNRTNSVWHALDSADQCVALSELNSEEDSFVLAIADGEVLLAGGRREINPRESEWKEPHGQEKIAAGMQKELRTVIQDKQALKPLSSAETAEIKQCCPDRILESRVVLTEKVEESGNLIVKARWTARGDKDPDLFTLVREGRTQAYPQMVGTRFFKQSQANVFHFNWAM